MLYRRTIYTNMCFFIVVWMKRLSIAGAPDIIALAMDGIPKSLKYSFAPTTLFMLFRELGWMITTRA
jgi:hypothetical protein